MEGEVNEGKTYGFPSICDNIYVTFGTKNIFKVFLPSLRSQPLEGLEWTMEEVINKKKIMETHERVMRIIEETNEAQDVEINWL
mmetsp:Transcript_36043/g.35647  ORF Transcript_36043/g.35647 Transcript_36043/m.35647 type:complete len:84 (+) Transcript_36043:110-361(+)